MSGQQIIAQLLQFGYDKNEILAAMKTVKNKNDINEITDFIQNKDRKCDFSETSETTEELEKIIEVSLDKLEKKKNFNIDQYLNKLKNKYGKKERKKENETKVEEKKENETQISLLTDVKQIYMCEKGHTLSNNHGEKCNQCGMDAKCYFKCNQCEYYDEYYDENMYDETGAKYYWCIECASKSAAKVKKILFLNKKREEEIIEYYENNPHISVDLLCNLPNKIALESLLKEVVVSDVGERIHFCLYQFDIDNFRDLNKTLGHDGADEKLKQIGEILRGFQTEKKEFWKKKGIAIERLWCFRQGGDEFTIVVKGQGSLAGGKIKTQFGFYELLKKQINGIGINISVGILVYGVCLDCTVKNWLALVDNALYETKKVKGKNSMRICDGGYGGPDMESGVVETFKDIYFG